MSEGHGELSRSAAGATNADERQSRARLWHLQVNVTPCRRHGHAPIGARRQDERACLRMKNMYIAPSRCGSTRDSPWTAEIITREFAKYAGSLLEV